jgi:hypothetical protein
MYPNAIIIDYGVGLIAPPLPPQIVKVGVEEEREREAIA